MPQIVRFEFFDPRRLITENLAGVTCDSIAGDMPERKSIETLGPVEVLNEETQVTHCIVKIFLGDWIVGGIGKTTLLGVLSRSDCLSFRQQKRKVSLMISVFKRGAQPC